MIEGKRSEKMEENVKECKITYLGISTKIETSPRAAVGGSWLVRQNLPQPLGGVGGVGYL